MKVQYTLLPLLASAPALTQASTIGQVPLAVKSLLSQAAGEFGIDGTLAEAVSRIWSAKDRVEKKNVETWTAQDSLNNARTYVKHGDVTYELLSHPDFPEYRIRLKSSKLCDPSVKQYSGYLDIGDDKHLFFWFFESRKNPSKAPLVLWLNGGPGCSSSTGLLFELGPCRITDDGRNTKLNKYSWNEYANMIFLDQPVNVGYSYSQSGTVNNTPAAAEDVYAFLQLFLSRYPEYEAAPFSVAAESYGGHYAPHIASTIYQKNKANQLSGRSARTKQINLNSVLIGNGLTEPYTQFASIPEQACGGPYPVYDDPDGPQCQSLRSKVPTCQRLIQSCYTYNSRFTCVPAGFYCNQQLFGPFMQLGLNPYDVRRKCDRRRDRDGPLCYPQLGYIENFMNNATVKNELGADEFIDFKSCNMEVNQAFFGQGDGFKNSASLLPELLADGIRLLVYAGNADFMCNAIGNLQWMERLDNLFAEEFQRTALKPWRTHATGKVVGEVKSAGGHGSTAGNYTYVVIHEAGHMVPYDQPEAALDLFASSLSTLSIPQRLQMVNDRQDRWAHLAWRRVQRHALFEGCPMYELYGGAFAQLWDYRDIETGTRQSCLNVLYLPSVGKGTIDRPDLRVVRHGMLDVSTVLELAIDPSQDLLVLISQALEVGPLTQWQALPRFKLRFHFRRLSTNEKHPAATETLLEFTPPPGGYECRTVPLLIGDLFAFLYNGADGLSRGMITVWRWTTGEKLLYIKTPSPAFSFAFLSEDTIVVPCIGRKEFVANLLVYRVPELSMEPRTNFNPTHALVENPDPVAVFMLPAFNSAAISGYNLVCRSHPNPNPRPYVPPPDASLRLTKSDVPSNPESQDEKHPGSNKASSSTPPFQIDPEDRLVTFSFIFNVHFNDPLGHGIVAWQESHVLFTHISTLLDYLPPPLDPPDPRQPKVKIVSWDDWAHRARWLGDRCRRNWYSHTYGHRFVKPTWRPAEDHRDPFAIQVLDFNPRTVKRELAAREAQATKHPLVPVDSDAEKASLRGGDTEEDSETTDEPSQRDWKFGSGSVRVVTEPSTIGGNVFAEKVTTSLPYIETTADKMLFDFNGLMMCEEHVLNVSRRGVGKELELEVFCV
ncbi:hypothetical protein FRB99_001083 [Tulasnella sp. 403]|nr:hypothetical protein FRB99_001083 [Tulasnella sp. 403]